MNARDIMTFNPSVVTGRDTITNAATIMRSLDIGLLPVVDTVESRHLIGVITDRDIVVRCRAEGHQPDCAVQDHMTRQTLTTVTSEASLREIADKMEYHQVRRLPVVDADNAVIGIVTQADLARHVGPSDPKLVEKVVERISAPAGALF